MKQTYSIHRDFEGKSLTVKEFAEMEKENTSLLCEVTYDDQAIQSAVKKGKGALISALRNQNLYPPENYINQIADSLINLYESGNDQPLELTFDDVEYLKKGKTEHRIDVDMDADSSELVDLLEDLDDDDEDFEEKTGGKDIDPPLRVAEDDILDIGGDS